ncbi:MAG: arylsulfatase [Chitinophagaceae bacterium]
MIKVGCAILMNLLILLLTGVNCIAQEVKPNVVFILADDLGYGDLGVYGQQLIRTPHLDALSRRGLRFTQFYTGSPVCAPSRSALMTGQHTGHTPIRGNKQMQPEGQAPLPAAAFTIAELFKKAGYATGDFGKWGLGFVGTSGDPNKQGFDRFFGYNCQRLAHDYYPDHLWNNEQRVELPNAPGQTKVYSADLIQQEALHFISANHQKPFFLFLSYTLPHAGLDVPEEDSMLQRYIRQFREQPVPPQNKPAGSLYKNQSYPHATYAAMVSKLDAYVGQVVARLKELKIDKNTLIIFASDNGPHKEGGNDPAFFNSNGGLRGIKRDVYEVGIRTPLIACWPAVIKPGVNQKYTGAFWDFLATFADITAQKIPAGTDGISLLPVLEGKKLPPSRRYLYWEFHEEGGKQAVRMGQWKAVRLSAMKLEPGAIQLYNLKSDPFEKTDVADKNKSIVERMKNIMLEAHNETTEFPFMATKAIRSL